MRFSKSLLITTFVLTACSVAIAGVRVGSPAIQDKVAYPSDLVSSFPDVKWGMSFQEAKAVVAKTGASPGGFNNNEISWDGTFNGTTGRATILLRDGKVSQMAILFYAGSKRVEVYNDLLKQSTAKYGKISEEVKGSDSISDLWKPSNDITIELRNVTDPDSPVIVIQWVHS